jgi:opacity protein-like surface antigen
MNRGLWTCFISLVILLSLAVSAFAESSTGSSLGYPRDRAATRDRASAGGFEGRAMLRFHGGISIPTGDFDNAVNTGFGLGASLGYGIGRNTILSWGVAYHRFGEEFVDGHVGITPVTMSVDYGFSSSSRVRPWISGGLGLYHMNEKTSALVAPALFLVGSNSENDFGFNFGFGIAMPTSGRSTFGAGFKFHHIVGNDFPDTDFLALQAGLSYPL